METEKHPFTVAQPDYTYALYTFFFIALLPLLAGRLWAIERLNFALMPATRQTTGVKNIINTTHAIVFVSSLRMDNCVTNEPFDSSSERAAPKFLLYSLDI